VSETRDIQATLERGVACFAEGNHGEAYSAILDVAEAAPDDPEVWYLLGTIALEGDHPYQAYQAFTRLRELRDDEDALMSQLASAYYAIDVETAGALAGEAIERYPESPEARAWAAKMERIEDTYDLLLDVGRTLCRQQRYADSIDLFLAAVEMRDEPEAYLLLGRAFLALGEAENAAPLLEVAAEALPEDDSICVDAATAYVAGGRTDIAKAWLHQGARVHPRSALVWQAIAGLVLDEGNTERALQAAEAAAKLAPEDAGVWKTVAGAREASGDAVGARIAVDRSLALDPHHSAVWILGGRIVQRSGDSGLASHYRGIALALEGMEPRGLSEPAPVYAEAEQLYGTIRQRPSEVRAYRDRATVCGLLGLPERALYYLDMVARDIEGDWTAELLIERAGLLLASGKFDEARSSCGAALALDPGSKRARQGLEVIDEAESHAAGEGGVR
jgi:Flp pilus assembly protein TadD